MRDWNEWMWTHVQELYREADSIRAGFLGLATALRLSGGVEPGGGPPVNVVETELGLQVTAALPGTAVEQIEVGLSKGVLVIAGRRSLAVEHRRGRLLILEIPGGRFERRLRLPPGEFELGERAFEHGLLSIELRRIP
jgi:HSP20 family protein